jgi:hypothetical protein
MTKNFAATVSQPVPIEKRIEEVIAHIKRDPKLAEFAATYNGTEQGDRDNVIFNAQALLDEQPVTNAIAWMIFDQHTKALPGMDVKSATSERYGDRPKKGNTEPYLRMALSADVTTELDFTGEGVTAVLPKKHTYNPKYVEGLQRLCALVPEIAGEFLAQGRTRGS